LHPLIFYLDLLRGVHEHQVLQGCARNQSVESTINMIALKQDTGRAQDESDVAHLQRLAGMNDGR